VADEKDRARIALQELLEQLEGVDVEVVGRLIEDQDVRGQREQARQQDAIALAAGESAQRRIGARRREQEIRQVAHHVLPAARRLDPLAARADAVGERRLEVERAAHLVEVRHLEARALTHRSRSRLQLAEDELEQGRLARAVRADHPDLVAAQDRRREVLDDQARLARRTTRRRREAHGNVLELGDDLAAGNAGVGLEADATERLASRRALRTQRLQPLDPADASRSPRLDAFSHPDLLLRQQLVGTRALLALGGELLDLPRLVGGERAGIAAQHAAVELDDPRRDGVEEGAVVGDDHDAALEADEQLLEPGDRVEVEVVGRLVEQQHVGNGDEGARQRDALLRSARELGDRARAVEMQMRQRRLDALLPVPRVERLDSRLQRVEVGSFGVRLVGVADDARLGDALADRVEHRAGVVEQRLLGHVANAQPLRLLQETVVELLETRDDLEQRRLAGAVAADQADALARLERQRCAIEQRDVTESEVGVGEGEDGHGKKAAQTRRSRRSLRRARSRARRRTSRRRRSRSAA
jgi:hypothetical protein